VKKAVIIAIGGAIVVALIISVLVFAQLTTQPIPQKAAPNESMQHTKIKVIASFYPLYEFSKNVGGEKAEVSVFIPIGIEPHDWEPSTGDLLELKQADIFVYNGGGMEPSVEQLIDSGEYSDVLFVETASGIDLIKTEEEHEEEHTDEEHADEEHGEADGLTIEEDHEDENEHDHDLPYDPHIWLDPILAKEQVATIKDALIKVDPANAQHYEDNANKYSAKLDELDSKIMSELSNCKKDTIVPFHNAFTYFGNRYGINIHALSGLAPESEATAGELKEFVDFVKENEIKIIFAEELIDPRLAKVLADEAGAQVLTLSPLEGISQQELLGGVTYLDKMEENLQNIKIALECQ
jgi:zinc transport system substrate-binding protein